MPHLIWLTENNYITITYGMHRTGAEDPNILNLERELTGLLGLKVVISHKSNNSGNMSIFYKNLDQLQPIIDKLKWRPK